MSNPAMTRSRYCLEVWNAAVAAFFRWRQAKDAGRDAGFEYSCYRNWSNALKGLGLDDPIAVGIGL